MTLGTFNSSCYSMQIRNRGAEGRDQARTVLVQRAQAFQELLCLFELRE